MDDAPGRYIEFVKQTFPRGMRLDGLKVVIDCAHGAAYRVAPTVFWELGAEVVPVGVNPNGLNINQKCGATDPSMMCEQVVAHGANIGIALDGDADRLIIADEKGRRLDGDQLMALIAGNWHGQGRLRGGGVVATVMSNLGFERYLGSIGLAMVRTPVGDRYVVEHMVRHQFNVGGEQSGHIILNDYVTTGDALIAALQVLAVVAEKQKPVSEVCRVFDPVPQLLRNVRINGGFPLEDDSVKCAIRDAEAELGKSGRLVIRPSGTEPVIRVMAEGDDPAMVGTVVDSLVGAIERAAGH
jgi:phosphoglucosamine mutase